MEDPKHEKAESQKSTNELLEERQSDATDDETLREVDESRLDTGTSDQDRTPSPDGAFDESKETKEFGPI